MSPFPLVSSSVALIAASLLGYGEVSYAVGVTENRPNKKLAQNFLHDFLDEDVFPGDDDEDAFERLFKLVHKKRGHATFHGKKIALFNSTQPDGAWMAPNMTDIKEALKLHSICVEDEYLALIANTTNFDGILENCSKLHSPSADESEIRMMNLTSLESMVVAHFQASKDVALCVEESKDVIMTVRNSFLAEEAAPRGLDRLDQPILPLDNFFNRSGFTGAGFTVYIIDTGVRTTHNEFGGRARMADFDFSGEVDNIDRNGHGTHVAGIAAGASHGVAAGASVVGVKSLTSEGVGTTSAILDGLSFAINDIRQSGKVGVINMSLGGGRNDLLDHAVRTVAGQNAIVIVAAGNSANDACENSPARQGGNVLQTGIMTVGNMDPTNDNMVSSSSFGACLDQFAPGKDIASAGFQFDSQFSTKTGTSMSAPFVAGTALLFLEQNNGDRQKALNAMMAAVSPDQIRNLASTNSPNKLCQVPNAPDRFNFQPAIRLPESIGSMTKAPLVLLSLLLVALSQ